MSTPTHPPQPEAPVLPDALNPELNPEAFTVAVIDQTDDVREFARDAADARLTGELNAESGRFRKMVRGVWKGNIAREYYRQKYVSEAQATILDNDTLYANREDVNEAARIQARSATIAKFVGDYEGVIHTEAGEKRKDITDASENGEDSATFFANATKTLIADYAEGLLTDDSLVEARTRLLTNLRSGASDQAFGEGVMVADNILEIAQNVKAAIEHGEGIDRVMEKIRVISGESRSGARTEAQYNKVDKVIARLNSSKAGSLVNETTLITAVSVAASLARFGSTKVVNVAAMSVAPGVGAGLIAGVRENKQIKDERRQHAREMATGQEYDQGSAKRRDAMQETLYETVSAQSLIEDLAVNVDPQQLDPTDEAALRTALTSVMAVQSRIKFSDSQNIDLIGYSSVAEVESERLVLDISLSRAKVTLRNVLTGASEATQQSLGFNVDEDFNTNLTNLAEAQVNVLEQDISQKDAAFNALKRREVAKTAAKAAIAGLVIGNGFQEIKAMIDPKTQGLVEQLWNAKNTPIDGRHHETLMHGIFAKNHGSSELQEHVLSGETAKHNVGHGTKFALSDEYKLQNIDGKFGIVDPQGKHISGIAFDKTGALTPDSIHKLRELGLTVKDKSTTITKFVPHTRQGGINDFLNQNKAGTTRISRDLWYDNNTPSPKFEQNELGLQWGGSTGMDQQGNYLFNAHAMTADGSFHGAEQAQWQQLASEGKLKMAFSANSETQDQVFTVNIDANGNAVIPKDSPIAQMFANENGRAVFQGKYAEVVQTTGIDSSGTEHIRTLATHVGQDSLGSKPFSVTDIVPESTTKRAYEVLGKNYTTSSELGSFIEMAPTIPLYSRKGLENILVNEISPSVYYHAELDPSEIERRRKSMSPRILQDPNAKLNDRQEIEWYMDQQSPEHRARVTKHAESVTEPMGDDVEIVVTIPVAGHQEADNIYRTLEAYKGQSLSQDKYEFMLYVNHPMFAKNGQPLDATATLAEIDRFKQDNPEMPIRVIYEALPPKLANIGYARKVMVDTVLERHMRRGGNSELVFVSNDADTLSVHENYLTNMLRKTKEEDVDATLGQLDWDNKAYVNYPEVHVGTRLFQLIDIATRVKDKEIGATSGANTAVRANIYAAVGGYHSIEGAGEDVELGRNIRAARAGTDRLAINFGGVVGSRIETSARRAVHAFMEYDLPPLRQWDDEVGFSAHDDAVRSINVDTIKPINFSDPKKREEVTNNMERLLNSTLKYYFNDSGVTSVSTAKPGDSSSVSSPISTDANVVERVTRAIQVMGIEFEWSSPGKIKITDSSKMINGLHNYALRAIRQEMIEEGVPTSGGFMMINGKPRKANGQFMSKREHDAIMNNLPRFFGSAAMAGA